MNDIKKICNATNLKYLAVALMFLDQIYQMFGSMGAPIRLTMLDVWLSRFSSFLLLIVFTILMIVWLFSGVCFT